MNTFLFRDLKPSNILLLLETSAENLDDKIDWETVQIQDVVLKISDYGLGRYFDPELGSKMSQTQGVGTEGYQAPEVLSAEGKYDDRADIWSFAVIMLELATKEKPKIGQQKNTSNSFVKY